MSEFVTKQIDNLVHVAEPMLGKFGKEEILGSNLAGLAGPLIEQKDVPVTAVLRLALLNDCVRIAERVVLADGVLSDAEVEYLYPLLQVVGPLLARMRAGYAGFRRLAPIQARGLLQQHERDGQPFGGSCKRSQWAGFAACRQLAALSESAEPLRKYEALMARLIEEVATHGGRTDAEQEVANRLRELVKEQTQIDRVLPEEPAESGGDRLERAFCDPRGKDVFHAVAHAEEIWNADPFDVEAIHSEARQRFDQALEQVRSPSSTYGRSLVLLGESGAGKTHLLRAFRAAAHRSWRAFSGYVQLSVGTLDYARLALRKLVDSLDRAYDTPLVTDSGLVVLSDALAGRIAGVEDAKLERLREAELNNAELALLTQQLADVGLKRGLGELHPDVLRAFLLLQRRDPALRQRVLKWLRCEPLSQYERMVLGDIAAWDDDLGASRMLQQLGKLVWQVSGAALVLLVDQVEDLEQQGEPSKRFRLVADLIRSLTDHLPHALVVVASLEDFITAYSKDLTQSVRDRLERDPAPVRLTSNRRVEEIREIVGRRLSYLYAELGEEPSEDRPLYPFSAEALQRVRNLRTRDVIDWCATYHRRCRDAGELVEFGDTKPNDMKQGEPTRAGDALDAGWKEALDQNTNLPDGDSEVLELITWGFKRLAWELDASGAAEQSTGDGCLFHLTNRHRAVRVYAGLSNKAPQGGHLSRQLESMHGSARSHDASLVLLRSGEFPAKARTKIGMLLGQLVKNGARKVVVAEQDLRTLAALRAFWEKHPAEELEGWSRRARPVRGLTLFDEVFQLAEFERKPASAVVPPDPVESPKKTERPGSGTGQAGNGHASAIAGPPAVTPSTSKKAEHNGHLQLGRGLGLKGEAVSLDPSVFSKHTAIVGATNSGKTTLALSMLEQVLLQGIPVVMIDRKGDLCTYADPAFWKDPEPDPERAARKQKLWDRLDVKVYTPGESRGRPLSIQLAPAGMAALPVAVRGPAATHAAGALASMLSIKNQPYEQKLSILAKGIELLAETNGTVSIDRLTELIRTRDADLMNHVGAFKDNHFDVLAERLLGLQVLNAQLFESEGDELTGDLLFGRGANARSDKTRLTIVSTKGLQGDEVTEFWVAQLLSELLTWASRNPSDQLQAIVFLDEADLYLPATSKPATKEPMLDLLKRGRSAGLGVMLGTQNPGDFDYKARANLNTWFLGRVSQVNDIKRMKPLLSEARMDVSGKLANAARGEFYLLQAGQVTPFQAARSVMATRQLGEEEILELARLT